MHGHKLTTNIWSGLEAARIRCCVDIMDGLARDNTLHTYDMVRDILQEGVICPYQIAAVQSIISEEIRRTQDRLDGITDPCPALRNFLASEISLCKAGLDELEAIETTGGDQS